MAGLPLPPPASASPSGMNIPAVTSVGGFLQMKSARQLIDEERQQAEAANNQPVIQGLASYIKQAWTLARTAKLTTVEPKMLQSLRQRRGEYDPDVLAQIREQGGTEIYMMLTSNKCRAASAWMRDVLQKAWEIEPTPVPDLPPDMVQNIMGKAQQAILQAQQQGMVPGDGDIRDLLLALKDQAMSQLREQADEAVERMQTKMEDQLDEGGWNDAFSQFLDDITTFPSAFIKGPVVRRKPRMKWVPANQQVMPATGSPTAAFTLQVTDEMVLEWDRVDPFNIYPAPHASTIDDGNLIERHRLSRSDLESLKGVDGYSDSAINAVLDEYGRGGLHEWVFTDIAKAEAEGKSTIAISQNSGELIDALQFWGSVQGKLLIEWGLDEKSVPDPLKEYNVEAWLIGHWIIRAVVNPDPLGRKPYYKASYEEVPGAFWGNSVADLVRDTQRVCNAAARSLVNNMGIASGPQVWVNVDRMPAGESVTQMYPWKAWQTTSDPMGSTAPPLGFFQPDSHVAELMAVYEKFSQLADEYSGIPRYMTGDSPAGGAGRTASGMSMLMGNAGKSIKQVISNIGSKVIRPAIERLYFYNMRYGTDDDLKGDVNIVVDVTNELIAKEAAQQRRNEFLQLALNSPMVEEVVGMEGIAALLREGAEALDMNTDKIVPPIEILRMRWMQKQQAQMQQAMAMQQMQGGASGQPPRGPQPQNAPGPAGGGAQLMNGAPVYNQFQAARAA